jgi:hypothetical protein
MESEGWVIVAAAIVLFIIGGLLGTCAGRHEGCDAMCEERLHRLDSGTTCYCAEDSETWQECTWDGGCPRGEGEDHAE